MVSRLIAQLLVPTERYKKQTKKQEYANEQRYNLQITADEALHYYIKLERTVKIKDVEYNIFVDDTNISKPNAKLIAVEEYLTCEFDLSAFLGKKLNFGIDWKNKKLTSVEYYEA